MDPSILVDNIGAHLHLLEKAINMIILISPAIIWAGIKRDQYIQLFGNSFDRRHSFFIVSGFYLIINLFILCLLLRLGDLILMLPDAKSFLSGITQLATHKWILNPYAHFSSGRLTYLQAIYSSQGLGLLIFIWWFCNASLYSLMDDKKNRAAKILLVLFVSIGICSIFAIYRGFDIILETAGRVLSGDREATNFIRASRQGKDAGAVIGSVIGVAFFWLTYYGQKRWLQPQKKAVRPQDEQSG